MEVQKIRLDTVALNLANVNTTRGFAGGPFQPLEVIIGERYNHFNSHLDRYQRQHIQGAQVISISPSLESPRLVYDPEHPDANGDGYVAFPNIDPVSEMVKLMDATRAYEANVRVANAAKTMALRALEIGD